ncbi:MAG: tyrosine-type recombinase/integrase [Pseudonocardiaceae bacterium]
MTQTRVTDGYRVVVSTPKTAKSASTTGLDPVTVAALRAHLHRQHQERLAWGPAWTDSGLVLVREDGVGFHPQRLAQLFERLVKAAKLPALGLHGLRHSYATAALDSGVDIKTISTRLGHASISVTGDLYAHTLAHVDQAAADRTASFIFGGS